MADLKEFEDLGFIPDSPKEESSIPTLAELNTGSKDALIGAGMGLTQDFGDEIVGAFDATKKYLTGDNAKGWLENYRQAQQSAQESADAAYERSPWLYSAGKGAGMIAPALLTAGSTGAIAGKEAIKKLLSPSEIIKKYTAISGLGAGMGALGSAAASKGNLDTEQGRSELLGDTLTGAGIGAVLSPIAAKGTAYIGKKFSDNPTLRQLAKSFKYGTEGVEISEDKLAKEFWTDKNITAVRGLTDDLLKTDKAISRRYGQVINQATKDGVEVIPGDFTKSTLSRISKLVNSNDILADTPEVKKLGQLIDKINLSGTLTPRELVDAKQILKSISKNVDMPAVKSIYQSTVKDINNELTKSVPGFETINDLMGKFREIPETIIGNGKRIGDIDSSLRPQKLEKSLQQFVSNLTDTGASDAKINAAIKQRDIIEKLKNLGLPEEQIAGITSKLEGIADDFALNRGVLGSNPQSGWKRILGTALSLGSSTTGEGIASGAANRVGGLASIPVKAGKALFQASEDQLSGVAKRLVDSGMPVAKNVGEHLLKGLADKNLAARNAALFSIVQNPELKALLGYDNISETASKVAEIPGNITSKVLR